MSVPVLRPRPCSKNQLVLTPCLSSSSSFLLPPLTKTGCPKWSCSVSLFQNHTHDVTKRTNHWNHVCWTPGLEFRKPQALSRYVKFCFGGLDLKKKHSGTQMCLFLWLRHPQVLLARHDGSSGLLEFGLKIDETLLYGCACHFFSSLSPLGLKTTTRGCMSVSVFLKSYSYHRYDFSVPPKS
jgi:hypothetical protein